MSQEAIEYLINFYKSGKDLYLTVHDKMTSEELHFFSSLFSNCTKILIHCTETINELKKVNEFNEFKNKIFLTPHPNYVNYIKYENKNLRKKFGFSDKDLVFMYYGTIEPRKDLQCLLKIFNNIKKENVKLLICGACSRKYRKLFSDLIIDKNTIKTYLKFIPERKFNKYFNTCDCNIFVPNLETQLNSASVIYSFSNKKTCIVPQIGTTKDITDKSFFFEAICKNNSEKESKITEKINYIINNLTRQQLKNMGNESYKYMLQNNSMSEFVKNMKEFYNV